MSKSKRNLIFSRTCDVLPHPFLATYGDKGRKKCWGHVVRGMISTELLHGCGIDEHWSRERQGYVEIKY